MLYYLLAIPFLFIIGLIRTLITLKDLNARATFTTEYANTYSKLITEKEFNQKHYLWLLANVDKMQDELGGIGVVSYQPPYQNYIMHDYHILVNTLPQIREGRAPSDLINGCQDVLIRYLGNLKEYHRRAVSQLLNPLRWFVEGIKITISFPIQIAYWSGLLNYQSYNNFYNGGVVKLLSFIVALITILASLVTIIVGWDAFIDVVRSL